jgi:hypothetical protein
VESGRNADVGPKLILISTAARPPYGDRILKGPKPLELPVQQPSRFHLVINLKAPKELGLTIAPTFVARADELIK